MIKKSISAVVLITCIAAPTDAGETWTVQTQKDWLDAKNNLSSIEVVDGLAQSTDAKSTFRSSVRSFKKKRSAASITFKQTVSWDNWKEVPNVGPDNTADAIVFLPVKDGDYWMFARNSDYSSRRDRKTKEVIPSKLPATEQNTGYHAWHSTDLKNWKHYGPVSGREERWVTTAEHVDGTFYIYYDFPNDEDPHLIIDKDLRDGKMGKVMGMAVNDPSHGSDSAVIRDEDGTFNIIFENWDPINARQHSWDSPLAGRAVSKDGINFKILDQYVVDHRTTPTGEMGEYLHPTSKIPHKYEIHTPEQDAYGDWTAIKVGGQYYLFCDYDPAGGHIKVGRFTSDSLDKQFDWCGSFGEGHPDPTVGFAEGNFYVIQQRGNVDFMSPGPWVPGVEARAGVDVSGNGKIDTWTPWQEVKESYSLKPGFSRVVDVEPAMLDLNKLPKGYGFAFEYRTKAVDGQTVNVVMDEVSLTFK
ncbi:MAG: hypothetical protein AB3N63_05060 [Puniceicoccaceae bacterium]